ncbi:MAG: O-antigen ligase family protein [Elusimicrobia bacterium]|nr:O-antigen ligase family protein [Elusimicrobiota bacterium]
MKSIETNDPLTTHHNDRPWTPEGLADLFSRLVAFSLPMTYFLVTVSFYLRTYDSAQIKITFAQIGCALVTLFWVLQLIFEKRWPFSKADLPVVAPFLAVLASGCLSYFQSSFKAGSLDEFIRRVFYVLMALVVIAEFRGLDRQRRLFRWLLASFGITVLYGFVQYFDGRLFPPGAGGVGLDPFIWRQAFSWRVFSSFGNPNFYGNFLVIVTPVILAFFFKNGGRPFRPFLLLGVLVPVVVLTDKWLLNQFGGVTAATRPWVVVGLLAGLGVVGFLVWWRSASAAASGLLIFFAATFVNLYATETKGAWVGFLGAMVATAVLVGLFLVGQRARRVTVGLLVLTSVLVFFGSAVVRRYAIQRRQSVDFRVFTWISTWDMIRRQPWLGTGIGSFKWSYPAYRRPEIILLEGRSNTETDHAEDEYLEIWYDEGLIGFGAFLWLIFAVSVLGLKNLRRLTAAGPRAPPAEPFEDRVYKSIAYLGAWWAALLHWFMDVSVRFVSSGIFSFLLPGLVVSLCRHHGHRERQDAPSPNDRRLRWGLVLFWALVFSHGIMAIPSIRARPLGHLVGLVVSVVLMGGLAELLEWRLVPGSAPIPATAGGRRLSPAAWQWACAGGAVLLWGTAYGVFRNYFIADINHNVGIFFSKQGMWTRSSEFDARVAAPDYPPEMRREYEEQGGALEHYETVCRLNPNFPMARYFIGNVYNDWGAAVMDRAKELKNRGDAAAAETLHQRAADYLDKALAAYGAVKAFAPNYVQTHHQVGLVYLKKAEMESLFGGKTKADENWDKALTNFGFYHRLDPVFPPNYYRESYVHFMRGDYEKAEMAYLGALTYNSENAVGRVYHDRNAETYSNLGRLHYILLVNQNPGVSWLPANSPEFKKAESYYLKAMDEARLSGREDEVGFEPTKSLAVLYSRSKSGDQAKSLWLKLRAWNPEDPDVRRVFSPPPAS